MTVARHAHRCKMLNALCPFCSLSFACAGTSAHEPHAARVTGANLSRGRSRRRLARGVHGAPGLTWGQVQRPVKSRQAVLGAASALADVNAAPSTAAMSVEEHQGAAAATRTPSGSARAGTPVAQPTRQTQHQVEVTLSNEHLFRDQISSGCTRARPRPMRSRRGTASYGRLASSPSRSPQMAPEIRLNCERRASRV